MFYWRGGDCVLLAHIGMQHLMRGHPRTLALPACQTATTYEVEIMCRAEAWVKANIVPLVEVEKVRLSTRLGLAPRCLRPTTTAPSLLVLRRSWDFDDLLLWRDVSWQWQR